MGSESWKSIAIALGNAMVNHQYCEDHPAANPEPSCPFCQDRAIYRRFRAFAEHHGVRFPDSLKGASSVPLSELRRTDIAHE